MNGYEGMCMSGGKFLNNDKWQIKLLSEFYAIHIQHFMSDINSKNHNS